MKRKGEKTKSTKSKTGIRDQSSTDNPDREHVEYRWGPRAKIEFPEDKMIEFIKNVYGDDVPNDIEKRIERVAKNWPE
ncbi:4255_t:CDS:2 [Entrophospora sp. SA101]|nr:4255_t:CDS:2 [Entrophospora sp. SA101]CAJ0893485.1 3272_t:CDS:2 [Entrophospora sp. SA101]